MHEGGWTVKLCPHTRQLDIYDPDNTLWATTTPDRPAPTPTTKRRRPGDQPRAGRARTNPTDGNNKEDPA
ncbi:MAG: hypothetical protein OER95_02355 [Acidimicrobiia bacterium]|nr:hypothetical protein [Acidimicrobiia bacterium]